VAQLDRGTPTAPPGGSLEHGHVRDELVHFEQKPIANWGEGRPGVLLPQGSHQPLPLQRACSCGPLLTGRRGWRTWRRHRSKRRPGRR
jgi:hypothetical protein